jgi:hypothetical protein
VTAPTDLVEIRHKDQPDSVSPAKASREAYDHVWAEQGYLIVGDPAADAEQAKAEKATRATAKGGDGK